MTPQLLLSAADGGGRHTYNGASIDHTSHGDFEVVLKIGAESYIGGILYGAAIPDVDGGTFRFETVHSEAWVPVDN